MKCSERDLIVVGLVLTVGNFIYQAIFSHEWDVAAERSFFQGIAIFAVWLFLL